MAPSRSHTAHHGRIHKRGSSASSITAPSSFSALPDSQAFLFNRSETPKVTYEEPWNERASSSSVPRIMSSSKPAKIKPYLRKLSSHNGNSLDLSRPAAENEELAGLGIDEYSQSQSRTVSDINFTVNPRGHRHNRSTSNNSQYSTASSLRPTIPPTHLPPIYQAPRSFTPPISRSTPASVLGGSEQGTDDIMTDDEFRLRQHAFDPARRSGSISSSTPGPAPPLRLNTSGSSTQLGGSYSQSSASLTSPLAQAARSRGDTLKSIDTTSPSSRTSFDRAFTFIRGGRESPIDPASRAASIRAARQAFQEKELANKRKEEEEAIKQAEREYLRKCKQEERHRRKSDSYDRVLNTHTNRPRSVSDSHNEKSTSGRPSFAGRPSIGGRQYSDQRPSHLRSLPKVTPMGDSEKQGMQYPEVSTTRAAKGRWLRFVAWFKTRILRMSNRVHVGGS